ncbi:MAG: hypothetical protein ABIK89_15785, partial [Planctomycetota bacterium]
TPRADKPSYVMIIKAHVPDPGEHPRSYALLREAAEYAIIHQLSLDLSAYFQDYSPDDKLVQEYTRSDVPQILLQNRVLSLLCTPLEERVPFIELSMSKHQPPGEIHSVHRLDGSVYSRFDLWLPSGSTLSRPSSNVLQLDSKRLSLTLKVVFKGINTNVPAGFLPFFFGVEPRCFVTYQVDVRVTAVVKPWALLRQAGWRYYQWLDSFLDRLHEFLSFDDYLNRIQWDANYARLRIDHNSRKRRKQSEEQTLATEESPNPADGVAAKTKPKNDNGPPANDDSEAQRGEAGS